MNRNQIFFSSSKHISFIDRIWIVKRLDFSLQQRQTTVGFQIDHLILVIKAFGKRYVCVHFAILSIKFYDFFFYYYYICNL